MAQRVKNLPATQETQVLSPGREDSLEKGMATHSSILAWRIPWTEESGWATIHGVAKSQIELSDFHFVFPPLRVLEDGFVPDSPLYLRVLTLIPIC